MNARLNSYVFYIAATLGALLFIALYGVAILNPFNTQWLLAGGDLAQHYIGWQFFQQSAWTFPLGVAKNLAYPHGLAITFMDSIPLLAIPAKLLFGFVHQQVQYFGFWGLLSFSLTAGISAVIIRRWTKNTLVILLLSLLPLMMPIMLNRMFRHTALAGHWILVLGVWCLVALNKATTQRFVMWWSLCLSLSAMVHPYILVMNAFLLSIALIWSYKNIRQTIVKGIVPIVAAIVVTWLIGGFTITSVAATDLGQFGFDAAALINPDGWSLFYDIPYVNSGYGESFSYVGLGVLLLVSVAVIVLAVRVKATVRFTRKYLVKTLLIALLVLLMLQIAIGPHVHIFGITLFEYDLPRHVEKAWSIVRATARMVWPLHYLVLFGSLFVLLKLLRKRNTYILVSAVAAIVSLQFVDVLRSQAMTDQTKVFYAAADMRYISTLTDPGWNEVVKGREHLVYLGGLYGDDFWGFSELCIHQKMTLNNGYFARSPAVAIQMATTQAKTELKEGNPRSDTVYVYKKDVDAVVVSPNIHSVRELNGFVVVTNN